ncbi:ATP-dependent protease [Corynebacterium belfantii]|nr:ATP-dependent protease [Corynebacterium belfantii]MBG9319961.1 ATP-dependent protease [Corynebacterium belfantii]MBG9331028.1 ATP-dependent protease [Corynebacterium belfantii]
MVIFDPLSQERLTHIVEIQIVQLAQRLAARPLRRLMALPVLECID